MAHGDRAALDAFYHTHSAALLGLAMRLLGSREDAEEVLQDTFVKLWTKAADYDASKSRPFTWAALLLRGLCIDRLRSKSRRIVPVAYPANWEPAAANWDADAGLLHDTKLAWETLSPEDQKLLERAVFGPLTAKELAAADSQPLGTVKTRLRRALHKFFHRIHSDSPETISLDAPDA